MKTQLNLLVCLCFSLVASIGLATFGEPIPIDIDAEILLTGPSLSADELTIYFSTDDTHSTYPFDLLYATRPDTNSAFGTPLPLFGGTLDNVQCTPFISPDGLSLYYISRDWPATDISIYFTKRSSVSDPFLPGAIMSELDSLEGEWHPSVTSDERAIFFSTSKSGGLGGADIYMAARLGMNSPFGTVINLTALNTTSDDLAPCISPDGKTVFFVTDRSDDDLLEIWMATRSDTSSAFGAPTKIEEINMAGVSSYGPWISPDGQRLYFASDRPGSLPGGLWMARVIPRPAVAFGGGLIIPEDDGLNTHPGLQCFFRFDIGLSEGSPAGEIRFFCPKANIYLRSTSIEQLVVTSGKIVQFAGWACVNGQQDSWFFVEAIDNYKPETDADRFEIKIWSPGDSPDDDPAVRAGGVLQGGNIVVHIMDENE